VSFTNLLSSSNPIYQDYKYKDYGIFYPYVVANFPTFTEIVHIDEPIYVTAATYLLAVKSTFPIFICSSFEINVVELEIVTNILNIPLLVNLWTN
jgi:hypothetical protein